MRLRSDHFFLVWTISHFFNSFWSFSNFILIFYFFGETAFVLTFLKITYSWWIQDAFFLERMSSLQLALFYGLFPWIDLVSSMSAGILVFIAHSVLTPYSLFLSPYLGLALIKILSAGLCRVLAGLSSLCSWLGAGRGSRILRGGLVGCLSFWSCLVFLCCIAKW